jgi:hypothetical protein
MPGTKASHYGRLLFDVGDVRINKIPTFEKASC